MGAAFRVIMDRVVAEATAGGVHPRVVQVGGDLREGFVLAVEHVHLCLTILLGVSTVDGGADYAARKDRIFGQRLSSIVTGQVVHGSVIVEEGFPFAGKEQVARCMSISGSVFR